MQPCCIYFQSDMNQAVYAATALGLPDNDMQKVLDLLAVSISGLCVIHCLLMPLALIMFPILSGSLFAGEDFHRFLVWVILPTSSAAFLLGCRRHKDNKVLLLGILGMFVLVSSAFWGHDLVGELGERLFTVLGGLVLAAAHLRNFRLCRHDHCEH